MVVVVVVLDGRSLLGTRVTTTRIPSLMLVCSSWVRGWVDILGTPRIWKSRKECSIGWWTLVLSQ